MNVLFVSSRPREGGRPRDSYQICRTKEKVNVLIPSTLIEGLIQRVNLQITMGSVPDPSYPVPGQIPDQSAPGL